MTTVTGEERAGERTDLRVPHFTPEEHAANGKSARAEVSRESHSSLDALPDRDPVSLLEEQAKTRVPELVPIRYGRMLVSPFAFYRGAAKIMAHDLAATPRTRLMTQLCGDAHLSNFGGFASPERTLVFDLNDFDEALPGPFEWDVKRLAASFEVCARDAGFDDKKRRSAVLAAVRSYREAMRSFAAMGDLSVWYAKLDVSTIEAQLRQDRDKKQAKTVQHLQEKARTKDSTKALSRLTHKVDGQLRIVSDPPTVVAADELSMAIPASEIKKEVVTLYRKYRSSLPPDHRKLLEHYQMVDLARKVVGVGSVGTRTWIVLLLGRDDTDPLFLQVKEAEPSVLEKYLGKSTFGQHGRRVIEAQRLMQSASDIFLGWTRAHRGLLDGRERDFYVRQLWDWKMSFEPETITPRGLVRYAETCGWTLARAHARSGDRIAIGAYLGKGDAFDRAIGDFAIGYADVNQRDYDALAEAVRTGRVEAEKGV
jgi:uncharacterized protein (DUF2252 family)